MHINFIKKRQLLTFTTFIFLFAVLFARLLVIQIINNKFFTNLADTQHKTLIKLPPQRGTIYDRLNRILAIYLETRSVYAVPREIEDRENTAEILSEELGLDKSSLREKLAKDNYFVWLRRKIDSDTERKFKNISLKGVYLTDEGKRFYPGGRLSCHLLGLTNIDNEGLEGIELYYDREIRGEMGWRRSYRDAKRREILSFGNNSLPARNGAHLILTIDEVIQNILEREIENIVEYYQPKAVSVIAMEPAEGEILGLANYPWFNPNDVAGLNMEYLKNRAISDSFEPGSVFKIVTAAAALEEGAFDFDSKIFCENGAYKIQKRVLHDYKPYGVLTFREVIEKSSNIGVCKVANKLGKEKLYAYIKKFNIGEPTGVDLPGEASGIMRNVSSWSYVDMTAIPMGHSIAVTPLQLAASFSVIANGGTLMRPYVVKSIINEEGVPIKENKPTVVRRVISKETACKVKELLEGVVERGTGKRARIENFRVCGKTGTAEKVNPNGGYYTDRCVASFVGFAPYANPRVVLAVCVDEPQKKHLGGEVGAPAFKNMMEKILSYMEIEGDKAKKYKDEITKSS